MKALTNKVIAEDVATLRQAYQLRKREYDALRAAGEWSGAVMHAGILVELALKIAICKNMDVTHLPKAFQVHDLDYLLYCTGLQNTFLNDPDLLRNFTVGTTRWSMDMRYKGAITTQRKADKIHQALFDPANGVLTFLSTI
jgi:hypothetical protein